MSWNECDVDWLRSAPVLQINSECKLPNLASSLNSNQFPHDRRSLWKPKGTSHFPRFPRLVTSYRPAEPYKRKREKRNGRGQKGSNRFMPTQVQFWPLPACEVSFLKHHPGRGLSLTWQFAALFTRLLWMQQTGRHRFAPAALSGCWRISIKAQYSDASKGSDVTAATQDWLLHLHQHAGLPCLYCAGNITEPQRPEVTVKAHRRRRSSWARPRQNPELLSVNVTQSSTNSSSGLKVNFSRTPAPLKLQFAPTLQDPKGVHYPTYVSWGTFQSSLHLHPHCWRLSCSPVTPRTFQKPPTAFPNSSNIWGF